MRAGYRIGDQETAPRQDGFTLVELLVALTLVGLVAMLLFGGLRLGTRAWDAAHFQLSSMSDVQAVQNFLRQRIAEARTVPAGKDAKDARSVAFDGGPDRIAFVTSLPAHVAPGGLYRLEVGTEEAGSSRRLVLSWRRMTDGDWERAEAVGSRILLEEINAVTFSYFGDPAANQDPSWSESWHGATRLPRLVRLQISFAENDRRSWPQLTVAIGSSE